jgi:hypothetical protein
LCALRADVNAIASSRRGGNPVQLGDTEGEERIRIARLIQETRFRRALLRRFDRSGEQVANFGIGRELVVPEISFVVGEKLPCRIF